MVRVFVVKMTMPTTTATGLMQTTPLSVRKAAAFEEAEGGGEFHVARVK